MSEPIVFIAHSRVKEGKLDGLVEFLREGYKRLEPEKPHTLASLAYLTNGTELTVFHLFADADSYDVHQEGAEERLRGIDEFLEPGPLEIYGKASDLAMGAMGQSATSGEFLAGFLRLTPG